VQRYVVSHGLSSSIVLQAGYLDGSLGLAVLAGPPTKIAKRQLQVQLGQVESIRLAAKGNVAP
jgi:hypothetical protein